MSMRRYAHCQYLLHIKRYSEFINPPI